jgi:hypothetical protein
MAKKKIEVIVKQGVKFQGKYPPLGCVIKIEAEEARRLIELGAVELPRQEIIEEDPAGKKSGKQDAARVLIAKIKAAQSVEELEQLAPENPSEAVVEAASQRAEELGNPAT